MDLLVGWVLGLFTLWIGSLWTRLVERCDVARVLVQEVRFNQNRAQLFAALQEQSVPKNLDVKEARLLPGTFATTVFDATLARHSLLGAPVLAPLHLFYRLLRQAEQFRDAASSVVTPAQREGLLIEAFESGSEAATVANNARLVSRLDALSRWFGQTSRDS